jgi:hypothetical protein
VVPTLHPILPPRAPATTKDWSPYLDLSEYYKPHRDRSFLFDVNGLIVNQNQTQMNQKQTVSGSKVGPPAKIHLL